MASVPPTGGYVQTGAYFRSRLATRQMVGRLEQELPEYEWRVGDSDQYRDYYLRGKRADGVHLKIEPEDEPDEYYLGVYFGEMRPLPDAPWRIDTARQLCERVLSVVEGVPRS